MILIRNPSIQDIMTLCAFRNPSNAEARAERMKNNVLLGKTNLLDHWLLEQNQQVVAVWSLIASGSMILMRSANDISNQVSHAILEHLEANTPAATLVVKESASRNLNLIALERGWFIEEKSSHFLTPLNELQLLSLDSSVQTFSLEELDSKTFQNFFLALGSGQSLEEIKQRFGNYQFASLQILLEGNLYLGAGVLGVFQSTAVMDLLGILPEKRRQGLGTRLHQHMLCVAQSLCDTYVGMTDVKNTAMLKIFLNNGCILNDQQSSLRFKQ